MNPNQPDQEFLETLRQQAEFAKRIRESPGGLQKWIGHVIKKGFASMVGNITSEFMFVRVKRIEKGQLVGELLNEPQYASYHKIYDQVVFDESEITHVAE